MARAEDSAHSGGPVTISLAGPLRVERDGTAIAATELGSRKARVLLRLLAAHRSQTLSSGPLSDALWPGTDRPADPDAVLAGLVSRLRRVLGPGVIIGGRTGYRLAGAPAVLIDLDRARDLLDEGERRSDAGEPALARAAGDAAIAVLGTDTALPEEPDAEWADSVRAEVAALRRRGRHLVATAALHLDDLAAARDAAAAAVAEDHLDETATRLLMNAALLLGEPAVALRAFEQVRRALADELGTDPSPATRELHLTALHGEAPAAVNGPVRRRANSTTGSRDSDHFPLIGRDDDLAVLRGVWSQAVQGSGGRLLIVGEAGIGKTRLASELADIAAATGASVLTARCYDAERSLFAQPVVDALSSYASTRPAAALRTAAGEYAGGLGRLLPNLATVFGDQDVEYRPGNPAVELQRTFDAVTTFLERQSRLQPVLLLLDDLHHAGRSTLELLHYLGRQLRRSAVLVVAALREDEGAEALAVLGSQAHVLSIGPLSDTAVAELAAGAGQPTQGGEIARRTAGHPLYVVETLRALRAGQIGLPASLQEAVSERVSRTGPETERVLRAAAILGAAFTPAVAAGLLELPVPTALDCCELALAARLLVPAGADYEFAHDIVRDVLLETTPLPTRIAHHGRAADLLAAQPEAVATHAEAIGDQPRAGRAWLLAAEQALARFAAADAKSLAARALVVATAVEDPELAGRAHIARGRALDAVAEYAAAFADFEQARLAAHRAGDRRLEMAALRQLAGDVPVAMGRPPARCEPALRELLTIAATLGDRTAEADTLGRLTVLACNRLDFTAALGYARRALAAGRAGGDERALVCGLDATKAVQAFLGDVTGLAQTVGELEPRLRRQGDLWLLQWAVFESSFVSLAAEDYLAAFDGMQRALDVCRRSGYVANEPFFLAHLGWAHRLAGDLDQAISLGRRAVAASEKHRHMWWSSASAALLGATLVTAGRRQEAAALVEPARRVAAVAGTESYLLRCVAVLAAATGSSDAREQADALLATIAVPPGHAFLIGADSYLLSAQAWARAGRPERATAVLAPFRAAAVQAGWPALVRLADEVG